MQVPSVFKTCSCNVMDCDVLGDRCQAFTIPISGYFAATSSTPGSLLEELGKVTCYEPHRPKMCLANPGIPTDTML